MVFKIKFENQHLVYYYNPLWIIHNFEYDYGYTPDIQYFNVCKTVSTQKGVCYDFAHLFAAFCRCQNISCYVIDGDKSDYIQYHHTWNRVYFFRLPLYSAGAVAARKFFYLGYGYTVIVALN